MASDIIWLPLQQQKEKTKKRKMSPLMGILSWRGPIKLELKVAQRLIPLLVAPQSTGTHGFGCKLMNELCCGTFI